MTFQPLQIPAVFGRKKAQRATNKASFLHAVHLQNSVLCNSSDMRISPFVFRQQSIRLREKSIVGPTERSKNANAFFKLGGEDRRFSMKVMLEAGL
jgi:hypothetical protein